MNRRQFLPASGAGIAALSAAAAQTSTATLGRIQQSVCRWCYAKTPIEELAAASAKMGIVAMDLVAPAEWDAVRKAGLRLTVVPGPTSIPDGLNRKENHDAIEAKFPPMIEAAAKAKAHSIIVFSGNRKGMNDQEGAENCIIGLNRLKKYAEGSGVMIVMELLNSKVNHKDYMCDKTAWGVQVMKGVGSPMVKLLYDIYHMQIMEGDIIRTIRDNIQYLGHFHTAGNPGRHQFDDTQEMSYKGIAQAIVDLGYKGYLCHEYSPTTADPLATLDEMMKICDV